MAQYVDGSWMPYAEYRFQMEKSESVRIPIKSLAMRRLPISRHMAELKAAGNMMGTKSHMSLKSRQIRMQR